MTDTEELAEFIEERCLHTTTATKARAIKDTYLAAATRLRELEAERDRYRAALEKYGGHLPECKYWLPECSCGLDAALKGESK